MVAEVSAMGVQHREHGGPCAEVLVVHGQRQHGVGGAAQERVVDDALMAARDGSQRRRQREGEQEVLAG